jgi:hypothetical protein
MRGQPVKLNVSYHQQDQKGQDSYCGAAAAQMVLHAIGADLIDQDVLFKTSHVTNDDITWHSAPDGLRGTLEAHKPDGFDLTFTMWPISSVEAMSRKVCWSIFKHKVPPTVLHNGCHWVVVTGFEASDEPKGPDDLSYEILKFYVHNPEPATSSDPPPHTSIDIDHEDDHCRERGTADEEIEYSDWVRMRSCLAGKWEDTYIVICDSDEPATLPGTLRKSLGDRIEGLAEIRSRANKGLFDADLPLPNLPEDAPHELPDERYLVEREDFDPPEYYYIVPFRNPDGEISLLVSVSAHEKGEVKGSISAPGPTSRFAQALRREAVIQRFAGKENVVGGRTVEPKEEELYEFLVWRPCIESLSPFLPFYRFDIQGQDGETTLYVRIDGQLFPELHVEMGM